jgi:hypothetical protein
VTSQVPRKHEIRRRDEAALLASGFLGLDPPQGSFHREGTSLNTFVPSLLPWLGLEKDLQHLLFACLSREQCSYLPQEGDWEDNDLVTRMPRIVG